MSRKKEGVLESIKGTLMITDSNQACITKMSGCGLQEELTYFICRNSWGRWRGK
jgi:hypothetical protein